MLLQGTSLSQILNIVILFLVQFVAIFIGSYIKEYYSVIKKKHNKIKLGRVTVTALTISFVTLGVSSWLIEKSGIRIFLTLCFLLGASGSQTVNLVLDGTMLKIFGKIFFKNIADSVKETIEESRKDNK